MRGKNWRQVMMVGVLVLIGAWLTSLIWGLAQKAQIAVSQAHQAQAQYEALEKRKAALEGNLDSLATPRGQDAAIRTAFGVARPGEEVIVVVPPSTSTASSTKPWWKRIFGW